MPYIIVSLGSNLTSISQGNNIIFNTISSPDGGSQIAYDVNTGYFTLQPNATYLLEATLLCSQFSNAGSGTIEYEWINVSTGSYIVQKCFGQIFSPTNTLGNTSNPLTSIIFSPTVVTEVALNVTSSTGTCTINQKNSYAIVSQIGGFIGATGSQGIAGTQGLQGITGIQGIQGITGTQGHQGFDGIFIPGNDCSFGAVTVNQLDCSSATIENNCTIGIQTNQPTQYLNATINGLPLSPLYLNPFVKNPINTGYEYYLYTPNATNTSSQSGTFTVDSSVTVNFLVVGGGGGGGISIPTQTEFLMHGGGGGGGGVAYGSFTAKPGITYNILAGNGGNTIINTTTGSLISNINSGNSSIISSDGSLSIIANGGQNGYYGAYMTFKTEFYTLGGNSGSTNVVGTTNYVGSTSASNYYPSNPAANPGAGGISNLCYVTNYSLVYQVPLGGNGGLSFPNDGSNNIPIVFNDRQASGIYFGGGGGGNMYPYLDFISTPTATLFLGGYGSGNMGIPTSYYNTDYGGTNTYTGYGGSGAGGGGFVDCSFVYYNINTNGNIYNGAGGNGFFGSGGGASAYGIGGIGGPGLVLLYLTKCPCENTITSQNTFTTQNTSSNLMINSLSTFTGGIINKYCQINFTPDIPSMQILINNNYLGNNIIVTSSNIIGYALLLTLILPTPSSSIMGSVLKIYNWSQQNVILTTQDTSCNFMGPYGSNTTSYNYLANNCYLKLWTNGVNWYVVDNTKNNVLPGWETDVTSQGLGVNNNYVQFTSYPNPSVTPFNSPINFVTLSNTGQLNIINSSNYTINILPNLMIQLESGGGGSWVTLYFYRNDGTVFGATNTGINTTGGQWLSCNPVITLGPSQYCYPILWLGGGASNSRILQKWMTVTYLS